MTATTFGAESNDPSALCNSISTVTESAPWPKEEIEAFTLKELTAGFAHPQSARRRRLPVILKTNFIVFIPLIMKLAILVSDCEA
jgi:hypothetical protein